MIIETTMHALMITGFVFVMMLIIEYINVQTRGSWQESLKKYLWAQYLMAAFLGAVPGCLGAFTVVALYAHNVVSFGALVTVMVATSGDEAFVMFSMFPGKAFLLTAILFLIGMAAGYVADIFFKPEKVTVRGFDQRLQYHDEACACYPKGEILDQLKDLTLQRGLLLTVMLVFIFLLVSGRLGPEEWNWIKVTLLAGSLAALFIAATVPEHFLEEHLWNHIVKVHIPRVFLWTFGALLALALLSDYFDVDALIRSNQLVVLLVACLVGLIPESGPHMMFVILYAEGSLPFGTLLASSIVQDGHGMLPLLAESKKSFLRVKVVNFGIGLLVGLLWYATARYF